MPKRMKHYTLRQSNNPTPTIKKPKSISEGFFDWLVNTSSYEEQAIEIDWDRVTEEFVELDVDLMDRCEKKVKAYLYSLLVNDFAQRKRNADKAKNKNIGESTKITKQYQRLFKESGFDWVFGGPNTDYDTPVVTINWELVESNMYKFSAASKKMYERMVIAYFMKVLEQCININDV